MRILVAPAKAGGRVYLRAVGAGLGAVTVGARPRLLGAQVLKDLQTFVAALDSTFGGFRERAEATYALLQAPGTAFLVVAAPEPDALREASYFVERLAEEGMPLAGLVVNRVHRRAGRADPLSRPWRPPRRLGARARAHGRAAPPARRAARSRPPASGGCVARFAAAHPGVAQVEAPAQATDVHDLAGLRQVAADLLAQPGRRAEREALRATRSGAEPAVARRRWCARTRRVRSRAGDATT